MPWTDSGLELGGLICLMFGLRFNSCFMKAQARWDTWATCCTQTIATNIAGNEIARAHTSLILASSWVSELPGDTICSLKGFELEMLKLDHHSKDPRILCTQFQEQACLYFQWKFDPSLCTPSVAAQATFSEWFSTRHQNPPSELKIDREANSLTAEGNLVWPWDKKQWHGTSMRRYHEHTNLCQVAVSWDWTRERWYMFAQLAQDNDGYLHVDCLNLRKMGGSSQWC